IAQQDDYCFLVTVGSTNPITLQGGSDIAQTNYFSKVTDYPKLVAAGGVSDIHDRYSSIPHATYEFKIPLYTIGISDKYKFFAAVYDAHQNKMYAWPQNISEESFPHIPAPSNWGELVSPDKSLPEFPWPLLMMIISFPVIIFITRRNFLFR
ncbi:MAG: hypothetical protein KGH86_08535, partial [Thaumarchaeota archaeon]|nr:hypothetical protein [Nitrososphaerota archaeon]